MPKYFVENGKSLVTICSQGYGRAALIRYEAY